MHNLKSCLSIHLIHVLMMKYMTSNCAFTLNTVWKNAKSWTAVMFFSSTVSTGNGSGYFFRLLDLRSANNRVTFFAVKPNTLPHETNSGTCSKRWGSCRRKFLNHLQTTKSSLTGYNCAKLFSRALFQQTNTNYKIVFKSSVTFFVFFRVD